MNDKKNGNFFKDTQAYSTKFIMDELRGGKTDADSAFIRLRVIGLPKHMANKLIKGVTA